jgi:hypothetical protein
MGAPLLKAAVPIAISGIPAAEAVLEATIKA